MRSAVTVIILTHNEEANIDHALRSVVGWAEDVFVLDSFSTDRTCEIAKSHGARVFVHPFENYALQRNHALTRLPIQTEWVYFLDADEWLPCELRDEINRVVGSDPAENGFFVKWRFMWMGRWIRHGYYPTWVMRLFRHGKARCEARSVNEHLVIEGATGRLEHDFIHEDRKGIGRWIDKHNHYASLEAEELFRPKRPETLLDADLFGSQSQRRRWIRYNIWNRLPASVRPGVLFTYRMFVTGGVLDGPAAWGYHFLHALWFPLVIELKLAELRRRGETISAEAQPAYSRSDDPGTA